MKQQIKNLRVAFDNDGFVVMANDEQGREYVLLDEYGFFRRMSYVRADMVIDNIKAAGHMVNPDLWAVRAPYGSDAWMIDGMEDRYIEDERHGFC